MSGHGFGSTNPVKLPHPTVRTGRENGAAKRQPLLDRGLGCGEGARRAREGAPLGNGSKCGELAWEKERWWGGAEKERGRKGEGKKEGRARERKTRQQRK